MSNFDSIQNSFEQFQLQKDEDHLNELKIQLGLLYHGTDKEHALYHRRLAIVIYDSLHKNTLPTISSEKALIAIQQALNILYLAENKKEQVLIVTDLLYEAGLDWIMGEKFTG